MGAGWLEQAELRQIRIHALRHTFASLLLQQGESVVYMKEQLGTAIESGGCGLPAGGSSASGKSACAPLRGGSGGQPPRENKSKGW